MKKLYELLGQRLCKGDVGVEIECEGTNLQLMDTTFWRTERDGSLRGEYPSGAAEYVMNGPVTIDRIDEVLDEIIFTQAVGRAKLDFSFRTSVHVHVNAQSLTETEMLAFLYLCLLMEEPLMNFCGESRKGNRFCLRYADAEGYDQTLDKLFDRGAVLIPGLDGNRIRYAAINIHSLKKYGSIEFRGMRGNMDKDTLKPWCETLVHLREYAKELGSPVAVYNKYISTPNSEFVSDALGAHHELFRYEGFSADLDRSFSLTIDLPHIHKAKPPYVEPAPRKAAAMWVAAPIARADPSVTEPPIDMVPFLIKATDKLFEQGGDVYEGVLEDEDRYCSLYKNLVRAGNRDGWDNFLINQLEGVQIP